MIIERVKHGYERIVVNRKITDAVQPKETSNNFDEGVLSAMRHKKNKK